MDLTSLVALERTLKFYQVESSTDFTLKLVHCRNTGGRSSMACI
jgi:hypothetical protein